MSSLDHFLDVASEEIEADLARWHPSVDLGELHRHGGLTHRKLWLLMRFLPMESAWKTWVRDNIPRPAPKPGDEEDQGQDFTGSNWSLENYQLQGLRNDLYRLLQNRKEGEEFVPPYDVPRSKVVEPEQPIDQQPANGQHVISLDERRELLAQVRARRGHIGTGETRSRHLKPTGWDNDTN